MYGANLNANSNADKKARKIAEKNAEKEDHVPRSIKKSEGGRKQDAEFRKQMQKAAKKSNKNRDFNKGRNQLWHEDDIEDLNDAAMKAYNKEDSDDSSDEDSENENSTEAADSQNNDEPLTSPASSSKETPSKNTTTRAAKDDKKDIYYIPYRPSDLEDRDQKFIESKLIQVLKKWALNNNIDHAKAVRNLFAVWHPDKQRFSDYHEECNEIFQTLNKEVKRLQEEKARRMAKFEKHVAQRNETQECKETEKMVKGKSTNTTSKKLNFTPEVRTNAVDADSDSDSDSDDCPDLVEVEEENCEIEARSHFSLTATSNNKAYVFGGEAVNRATGKPKFFGNLFEITKLFDKSEDVQDVSAKELPSITGTDGLKAHNAPAIRSAHQVCEINKNLFVFGGEWTSPDGRRFKQFDDLWRFDTTTNAWTIVKFNTDKKTNPCGRSGHRMVALKNRLFVFGGFVEQKNGNLKYLNDFYCIDLENEIITGNSDPSSLSWVADKRKNIQKPSARSGFSMWGDDSENKIYIFGGTCMDSKGNLKVLADCWAFDVESFLWEKVEQKNVKEYIHYENGPKIRTGMCVCNLNDEKSTSSGKVFFFGGVTDVEAENVRLKRKGKSVYHNDVLLFDYRKGEWSRIDVDLTSDDSIKNSTSNESTTEESEKFVPQLSQAYCEEDAKKQEKLANKQDETFEEIAPRGRIAAQCAHKNGVLSIFAGSCESELHKKEVTLDDMWRINIDLEAKNSEKARWKCVWQLTDNAKPEIVDDEDSDDESDDEAARNARLNAANSKKSAKAANNKKDGTSAPVALNSAPTPVIVSDSKLAVQFATEDDISEDESEDESLADSKKKKGGKKKESKKAQKKREKEEENTKSNIAYDADDTEQSKNVTAVSLVHITDPSTLSKKERVKWEKKQRQEVKIVKQMEKEAKKNNKKDAKLEKQKAKAKGGKKNGGDDEEDGEEASE